MFVVPCFILDSKHVVWSRGLQTGVAFVTLYSEEVVFLGGNGEKGFLSNSFFPDLMSEITSEF